MLKGSMLPILLIPVFLVAVAVYFYNFATRDFDDGKVVINDHEFDVEVADTIIAKAQGLSGRDQLGKDEGMLFISGRPSIQRFWMKDMLISIDIIWISDGKVVGFEKNASPEPGVPTRGLKIYQSPEPVELVLEVSAGIVDRLGISVGDSVSIRL